jgi:hypothetical protein
MIQQACKIFDESQYLRREAQGKICKICALNKVFVDKFGPGHYEGSFVILGNYFRVLYFFGYDHGIRVEECPPDDKKNKNTDQLFANSIYMNLSDFLWTFWPEGIYHIEKFLMDKE